MSDLPSVTDLPQPAGSRSRLARGTRATAATGMLLACMAVVLTFYLWLASVGSWTRLPSLTQTYDQLASAFLHGQLALLQEPDPALMAIPNPYDPAARKGIPFPLDVSLYEGRFYLYFGPVPALVLAVGKLITQAQLGDEYLVLAFVAGLFGAQSLLAFRLWRRFFQDVSLWALGAGLLVLGLSAPFGWLLGTANVYGAAVMGGACFLAAGLYAAFRAFDAMPISRRHLAAAGVLWAAAVGSRFTQALPVILLAMLAAGEILRRARKAGDLRGSVPSLLALLLPLMLGATLLGWYNWARFDSPLETGIRYQLSGGFQEHMGELFSPIYAIQNLANYLLAAPRLGYAFPYFKPVPGFRQSVIAGFPLPEIYWSSPMAGLLYTAPFIVFSVVNAVHVIRALKPGQAVDQDQQSLVGLNIALWIAFLSGFALFLVFFWSAERYLADFVPAWFLLSVIGFWQLGRPLGRRWPRRVAYLLLGLLFFGSTILVSNLLALSFNADGFRLLNPVLWRQLGNLFRP